MSLLLRITPAASGEEAAAVVAALTLLRRRPEPARPTMARWARAARLEALGQSPLAAANDPRLGQR